MLRMFYFSGTGNARNVAHWMASAWQSRNREAETIDLARVEAHAICLDPGDEVGIASPTHGFNFPPVTLRFLFAFPRAPNANGAFIVNTRAGVRFFGVCIPGLSGVAQLLAALVLLLKGYRVVGMRPIDLPSNWISLHPGALSPGRRSPRWCVPQYPRGGLDAGATHGLLSPAAPRPAFAHGRTNRRRHLADALRFLAPLPSAEEERGGVVSGWPGRGPGRWPRRRSQRGH